jgi:hypothetical protein
MSMRLPSLPFLACAIAALPGCAEEEDPGSEETSTSSSTTTATTMGGSGTHTSASGSGGSTGAEVECGEVCSNLYGCGLELDDAMVQLCPGFTGDPAEMDRFLHGDGMESGCIAACMGFFPPGVVDPMDCPGTIEMVKMLNPTFVGICDEGFPTGGSSGSE